MCYNQHYHHTLAVQAGRVGKRCRRLVRYIAENEDEFLTLQEPPPRAYLALVVEGRISHSFPLRGEVKLGREKGNTIVVADQKVSRHHATLIPIDDNFIIQDQGSANGTYVNGVQIAQPTRLQDNDRIGVGDTTFLYTTGQPVLGASAANRASSSAGSAISAIPMMQSVPVSANNTPIWLAIGCLAAALIILLVVLALVTGLFLGRGGLGLLLG